MTLKKDFLSLSALEEADLAKSLTDLFEKLYPPLCKMTPFGKSSILDIGLRSEYATDIRY